MAYLPDVGNEFVLVHQISPGRVTSTIEALPCTAGALVARNDAGEEIDRLDEPICSGQTWHIGGE